MNIMGYGFGPQQLIDMEWVDDSEVHDYHKSLSPSIRPAGGCLYERPARDHDREYFQKIAVKAGVKETILFENIHSSGMRFPESLNI